MHVSLLGVETLTVGALRRSVFWLRGYSQPICVSILGPEDARKRVWKAQTTDLGLPATNVASTKVSSKVATFCTNECLPATTSCHVCQIQPQLLNSLQFFHLMKTSYELHEDPDFVLIVVLEEVVDLSELFITCNSMINFSSLRLDNSPFNSGILLPSESA